MFMQNKSIRILGLSESFHSRQGNEFVGKDKFYTALNQAFNVIEVGNTTLTGLERRKNIVRNFRFDWEFWVANMGVNLQAFDKRTALAEQHLSEWEGQYDLIVQLHCLFAPGFNLEAKPYILYVDNTYILSEKYSSTWRVLKKNQQRDEWVRREREMYHKAKYVFTWSEFTRQSVINDYGVAAERVVNAGSGANLSKASLENKPYDTQVALFVGKEFNRKGGQTLLKAWEEVHRQLPNAQLWIVGPPFPTGVFQPGVKWFGSIKNRSKLEQLYNQASIFVLPSLFDPSPLVLKEAMGLGVPCVSTTQCAAPEFIISGETGLLVPPGDAPALAEAMTSLLKSPQLARKMGHRAHQAVQQGFGWNNVIDRMFPYIEKSAPRTCFKTKV